MIGRIEHGSVPRSGKVNQIARHKDSLFKIFGFVHSQNRRQFFIRKFFFFADFFNFADKNLRFLRNFNTGHFGNLISRLSDDFRVQFAVNNNRLGDLFFFLFVQDISTAILQLFFNGVINVFVNDNRLLGSANHAIVKGFAHQNGADGHFNVGCFVNNGRNVSCTDAESRFAGRISRFDHTRAAGCQNQVNAVMAHQMLREFNRRICNPADNIIRRTGLNGSFQHQAGCLNRTSLGTRMRRKDNSVTGLEGNHTFENCGRRRIGRRNNTGNNAERLGDFGNAVGCVMLDNAAGLCMAVFVINFFGGKMVFNHLVFHNTHTGFFHRHFCQRNTVAVGGNRHGFDNLVHLFLAERCHNFLSLADSGNQSIQIVNALGAVVKLSFSIRNNFFFHVAITPFVTVKITILCHYITEISKD